MKSTETLLRNLPDAAAATRFLDQLAEKHPTAHQKLIGHEGLLSDALTVASFSPLLATTLLQHPDYLWWLDRRRRDSSVRSKDELTESLARFSLTNSSLDPQILLSRFQRRELLRIFLRDIRHLATIAEITEEISNLADAIVETALELSSREITNRFGSPLAVDEKGRSRPATFCAIALGKLGSKELNYSSDIDLIFVYSEDGVTSGTGSKGSVTNREYFVKLAEYLSKLIGGQIGEGAAYRVDLRLRPHGSMGALTMSVADTVKYYKADARDWERQVMIRSRSCAGNAELYKRFFTEIEDLVFVPDQTVENALANVRLSKERIDRENVSRKGFDVKLGKGGIREIEFLSQALQLAFGGKDHWLRDPHTLISLSRLADRKHISASELTELTNAYGFLRQTEHILQMENGIQTHIVPDAGDKRDLIARKMQFTGVTSFENSLETNVGNVRTVFERIFGTDWPSQTPDENTGATKPDPGATVRSNILASIERAEINIADEGIDLEMLDHISAVSPHFAAILAANPQLAAELPDPNVPLDPPNYREMMMSAVEDSEDFGGRLAKMRRVWSRCLLEIAVRDIYGTIEMSEARRQQTELAEASIAAALKVVKSELIEKYAQEIDELDLAILALGKLGGRGLDYNSDLDLVIVYYDESGWRRSKDGSLQATDKLTAAEFYSRAVELFSTALSSMTREGYLYRVDLRLRPFGSKGMSSTSIDTFINYMSGSAAIWEMLAFVKLRAVGGDMSIGHTVENETRRIIHERALELGRDDLRNETRSVRLALEQQRRGPRHGTDIDIKYGEGGMLDIYFAVRHLQLRDNIPDDPENRSTAYMLKRLHENNSLSDEQYNELSAGYEFLTTLDHNLRLTIGRTTRVPVSNQPTLGVIAERMNLGSVDQLLQQLTFARLSIRSAFDLIIGE